MAFHPVADEKRYSELLTGLVELESPTGNLEHLAVLADHLQAELEAGGWNVRRHSQDGAGDHLEATRFTETAGPSTLILCHYDTVWPVGTLEGMPVRRDGNTLFGPGVLDMKAGIAAALHAVELLEAAGREAAGPVTLLLTSDEETGSLTSRALIEDTARRHDRVLVPEAARDDGAVKTARKGVGDYTVSFTGVSSHAGNSPELGASALRELAHFLLYAETLEDDSRGTTVNVTTASGGSARNVIAEQAVLGIDMRVLEVAEADRIDESLRTYRPRDSRVKVTVGGGLNRPPLEESPEGTALFRLARELSLARGRELEGATVGGGSDGSFTAALGVATLDGLGGVGSGPHARHEQIDISMTLERVELLAALLAARPD